MLVFHFLNVLHGDCIVIEYHNNAERVFGVVDSNRSPRTASPALEKLRQLGAQKLSFVAVTHPHRDHYSGIVSLLEFYKGRIDRLFTFPLAQIVQHKKRLQSLAKAFRNLRDTQDDPATKAAAREFIKFLQIASIDFGVDRWVECEGEYQILDPEGFAALEVASILPPKRAKSSYLTFLDSGEPWSLETIRENELSIALRFEYGSRSIILGGDGTQRNWLLQRKWQERSHNTISSDIVKLPHHGSRQDCDEATLRNIFLENGVAIVSANGLSHPAAEVIDCLERLSIKPYCTNLIPQCGANLVQLSINTNLDPITKRWLNQVADNEGGQQTCQGDIRVEISAAGDINIETETGNFCPYRDKIH